MAFKDPASRKAWQTSKRVQGWYAGRLRSIAQSIVHIINGHMDTNKPDVGELESALYKYAEAITPWANSVAKRMLNEVSLKDAATWMEHMRDMGHRVGNEIAHAPTGKIFMKLQAENVGYITSLPRETAQQAVNMATGSLVTGERYETIRDRIQELKKVPRWRATLIARTEVSKASSNFMQARAEYVGSRQYIWRTVGDSDVRDSHEKMEGRVCDWAKPPEVEKGKRYHAGCFPNCRCWAEPIIPEAYR